MPSRPHLVRWLGLWVLCGSACAGSSPPPASDASTLLRPSVREPVDDAERAILAQLPDWPPGQAISVAGAEVRVERAYPAASGRTCRAIHIRALNVADGVASAVETRLACSEQDQDWFFVPAVFPGRYSAPPGAVPGTDASADDSASHQGGM